MRVRYTRRAARQLVELYDYLHDRSPAGATNVMAHIRRTEQLIAEFPQAGIVSQLSGLRKVSVLSYPYVVFYEPADDEIVVHRIRHAARQPET